ncbi:hypothetical protein OH76DRAFT_1489937 [Lentinus brumalis]|uniref:F-box domain-containing protein n=1 Tax=Lentinus brumalis TaxID=2498619 RepID=A0A371CKQ9_9APHY|nr:hypothetical protein OH76DRAFT_1489937 [Polyporus brumalis]
MDRNALLNLAMTSRIFYEPAMSTLWYTLHTIVPLFYTLPTELCNMDKEEGRNKSSEESTGTPSTIIRFARVPVPNDFARWKKYSSYVKQILDRSPDDYLLPTVSPAALSSLALYGPKPLAPCLTMLSFQDYELRGSPGYAMRFFADTLTSIRLTLSNPCLEFPIYIAYLTKYAKKLEILALQYDPEAPSSWPNTYHCASFCSLGLLELSHLRGLRLTNIYTRPSAIRELASLPLLEQLDLSLKASYGFRDDRARTRGVQTEFSALRELTLHVNNFSLPLTILGNISAPCLKDLSIICTSDPSSDPDCIVSTSLIESVFGAIAAHPSLQRLCFWINPVQPPCNLSAAVRPLLGLPNITLLAMVNWIAITVDDATLDAMSRAWPGLECLNLHQASRYAIKAGGDAAPVHREAFPTSPKATLCGLIPLALHCPRLHTISLDIDTDLPASVASRNRRTAGMGI